MYQLIVLQMMELKKLRMKQLFAFEIQLLIQCLFPYDTQKELFLFSNKREINDT